MSAKASRQNFAKIVRRVISPNRSDAVDRLSASSNAVRHAESKARSETPAGVAELADAADSKSAAP
jgi:hypothetical protein